MRIVITSDTHALSIGNLPVQLIDAIKEADAVLHAGDIGSKDVYLYLLEISKALYIVKGNNDISFSLPKEIIKSFDGVRVAITHGDDVNGDIAPSLTYIYMEHTPDIIVHGHTHIPHITTFDGVTVINPGSPTLNRVAGFNSFAELTIGDGKYTAKHIKLPKR